MPNDSASPPREDQPLKFLTKIKVPLFRGLVWFPDNRRLALRTGREGIRIVDTIAKTVSAPMTDARLGQIVAISPDGSIAVARTGTSQLIQTPEFQDVRTKTALVLLSTETWREIAQVNTTDVANCKVADKFGFAFTPDGRFIWAGCGNKGSIQGAIKLTIPELGLADKLEFTEKLSPTSKSELTEAYVRPSPLTLLARTFVYSEFAPVGAPPLPKPYDPYLRIIDLATKADILPTSPLLYGEGPLPSLGGSLGGYLSTDRRSLLIYRGLREPGGIDTYDIENRTRVMRFAPPSEAATVDPKMQPDRGVWGLSNLLPLRNDRVAAAIASGNWDGGLMIWNYRTGELIQRIYAPGMNLIALSPDATRIVGGFFDEIYVYSLNASLKP